MFDNIPELAEFLAAYFYDEDKNPTEHKEVQLELEGGLKLYEKMKCEGVVDVNGYVD